MTLRQLSRGAGALRLCDLDPASRALTVECKPCNRRGRYRLRSLLETYGPDAGSSPAAAPNPSRPAQRTRRYAPHAGAHPSRRLQARPALVHNDLLYLCIRINSTKENIPNKLRLATANTEHAY